MAMSILRWAAGRKLALLFSFGFAILGLALALPVFMNRMPPKIRMSAGPDGTRRHAIAAYMCEQASQHKLAIDLVNNHGSEECLYELKAGRLDAAVVSSCVVIPDDEDIKVLGAAQLEAIHFLVRKDLAGGEELSQRLHGKRVNLGERGSTEWLLTRELLAFHRLNLPTDTQPGDIIPTEFGKQYLIGKSREILRAKGAEKDALIAGLPDCLMVLASMPSTVVQLLIEAADYQIVPYYATQAFISDNIQDTHAKAPTIQREFLERTTIPANSYFTTETFPKTDCQTIGVRLLVVARKDLPTRAVRPLMETIFEGEFSRRILPRSPRDLPTPYAIHPGAVAYLDRDKPLAIEKVTEWINKGLSLFGAFSAGALSLYGLFWRKKAKKPTDYFSEIRNVELIAQGMASDSSAPCQPKELAQYLEKRLKTLRQDLMEDICEGRIKGDQVITLILTILNDARRNLPNPEPADVHLDRKTRPAFVPSSKAA